jgi:hypothetical protein
VAGQDSGTILGIKGKLGCCRLDTLTHSSLNTFKQMKYTYGPTWTAATVGKASFRFTKGAVAACQKDDILCKLLASIDIMRVGRPREIELALRVIEQYLL